MDDILVQDHSDGLGNFVSRCHWYKHDLSSKVHSKSVLYWLKAVTAGSPLITLKMGKEKESTKVREEEKKKGEVHLKIKTKDKSSGDEDEKEVEI